MRSCVHVCVCVCVCVCLCACKRVCDRGSPAPRRPHGDPKCSGGTVGALPLIPKVWLHSTAERKIRAGQYVVRVFQSRGRRKPERKHSMKEVSTRGSERTGENGREGKTEGQKGSWTPSVERPDAWYKRLCALVLEKACLRRWQCLWQRFFSRVDPSETMESIVIGLHNPSAQHRSRRQIKGRTRAAATTSTQENAKTRKNAKTRIKRNNAQTCLTVFNNYNSCSSWKRFAYIWKHFGVARPNLETQFCKTS